MLFYIAIGLQLIGISLVTLCLYQGLITGDYNRAQLVQFLGGAGLFYLAQLLKKKSSS